MSESDQDELEQLKKLDALLKSTNKQWPLKLILCLIFVREHPSETVVNHIGLHWIDNRVFICNSSIFASFLGRKANTLNLNFRDHGFAKALNYRDVCRESRRNLHDAAKWKPHEHSDSHITKNCDEGDAKFVKYRRETDDRSEVGSAESGNRSDHHESARFPSDEHESYLLHSESLFSERDMGSDSEAFSILNLWDEEGFDL